MLPLTFPPQFDSTLIIKDYKAEYYKRLAELKRQYEVRLQAFETKKLEARQKYREWWTLDEMLETSHECTTSSELSRFQPLLDWVTYKGSWGSDCIENVSSATPRCCLYNDCNAVRTVLYKVFPSLLNHTLPEEQAPVHSITMPATFDLDLLTLDTDRYEDVHTRSQEEITLPG
ncbi:hypothetical protein P8452_18941 [Trifolium repens]|nr:hypothetical protein P8452_18941 [Trifolium repens]